MAQPHLIESMIAELRAALPGDFANGAEKNLRAALTAALAKLELVTREELDVQSQVLARTRQRLEALEKQVIELEQRLTGK